MRSRLHGWLVDILAEPPKRVLVQLGIGLLIVFAFAASATASVEHPPTSATHIPLNSSSMTLATPTPSVTPTYVRPIAAQTPRSLAVPQSVPGQPGVDQYTVALYHFDAPGPVALDATGNYTGTLVGNATMTTAGLYSGVLSLDGNSSYVRTGYLGNFSQGTIEAFVDFGAACAKSWDFTIVSAGGELGSNQPAMALREQTGLMFGIYAQGQWHWVDSGINACRYLVGGITAFPYPWQSVPVKWPYETWRFHHVAGTWGPRGMEIWVDGVLHGVANTDSNAGIYPYPYMCNPQMQIGSRPDGSYLPNPIYPVCQTPVPAPQMVPYPPPGDYYSGLGSYSTFLIGCDSSASCFTGRLDEVRISNIQRTFTYLVDPTVTPTPTWTPVPITGEYPVDPQTMALYHLNFFNNGVLEEVTQTYHGIGGQASIVPTARFGAGALSSTGVDSAIGTGNLGSPGMGTLEAWVDFANSTQNHPLFAAKEYYNSPGPILYFQALAQGPIRLTVTDNNGNGHQVDSDVTTSSLVSCWHHIAGTFGPRGMEIWIDGTLHGTNTSYTGGMIGISNGTWQAVCDLWGNCTKGLIDEVRVSNIQRTFTSQAPMFMPIVRSPSVLEFLTFLPLIRVDPPPRCPFGP